MTSPDLMKEVQKRMPIGQPISMPDLREVTGRADSSLRRILKDMMGLNLVVKVDIDEEGKKGRRRRKGYVRQV
jgi:GTPase Era involved in 16S rRNA processing